MISKLNMISVRVNCLTGLEMIEGKNGQVIFKNEWRKFDEGDKYSWLEVFRFRRVKGGC